MLFRSNAKVLFLGRAPVIEDAPDLRFLELKGKFEMRFTGPNGQPMTFGNNSSAEPVANLSSPGGGAVIGVQKLTSQGYIDVSFARGLKELDTTTITDVDGELRLILPNGTTIEITATPAKVTTANDPDVYRYTLPADLSLTPGTYTVEFIADSFADKDGTKNKSEQETFELRELTTQLAGPRHEAQIDILEIGRAHV